MAAGCWLGASRLADGAAEARAAWPRTASVAFVPPRELIRFLPYRELLSDILWCRTLVYYGSNWAGEGDLSQLEDFLDDIVALDPRFKPVYEWAAFAVTYRSGNATQDEFKSSIHYLELGMKQFPDEYYYFWLAGTRYYFDLWDRDPAVRRGYKERGAALIEQAMGKPNAPPDLAETAANMRGKLGQHQRALDNLKKMAVMTDDEEARQQILKRLQVEDPGLADELDREQEAFEQAWQDDMPNVPLAFFAVIGPRPPRVIDFRRLTTPHDLFGADEEP